MRLVVPVAAILAIFALYLFYAYNRKKKAIRESRRGQLRDTRQQYLEMTLKGAKENKDSGKAS